MPVTASGGTEKVNATGHGALTAPVAGSTVFGGWATTGVDPPARMSLPRVPP